MYEYDVIIPVYKPDEKLLKLLDGLKKQSHKAQSIILINTGKTYFENFISEQKLKEEYSNLQIYHVEEEEFDHGGTRNRGASYSKSPYFVLMTDDAIPEDEFLMERLLTPFADVRVGLTYGRQLPAEDCGVIERFTRSFNYPDTDLRKSAADLSRLGIKTFFASNVCAAYRREYFDVLKGFTNHTIFNEDMIYARHLIDAGFHIVYVSGARVVHSHNYTGIQQLKRNFDLGVSHAQYSKEFSNLATESEGIRLVKQTCVYLFKTGKPWFIIKLVWQSGCKYIGYFLGKRYKSLPIRLVKACSMNRRYWNTGGS